MDGFEFERAAVERLRAMNPVLQTFAISRDGDGNLLKTAQGTEIVQIVTVEADEPPGDGPIVVLEFPRRDYTPSNDASEWSISRGDMLFKIFASEDYGAAEACGILAGQIGEEFAQGKGIQTIRPLLADGEAARPNLRMQFTGTVRIMPAVKGDGKVMVAVRQSYTGWPLA